MAWSRTANQGWSGKFRQCISINRAFLCGVTDRIDGVLRADSVGDQKPHDLHRGETRITEARENGIGRIRRGGDEVWRGRLGVIGSAGKERQLGTAVAVCGPNGACKMETMIIHISTLSGR